MNSEQKIKALALNQELILKILQGLGKKIDDNNKNLIKYLEALQKDLE